MVKKAGGEDKRRGRGYCSLCKKLLSAPSLSYIISSTFLNIRSFYSIHLYTFRATFISLLPACWPTYFRFFFALPPSHSERHRRESKIALDSERLI